VAAYIVRRLLLMIPTLFGVMVINFAIVQFAPGGPVERVIARLHGMDESAGARIAGAGADLASTSKYRGARGLDPQFIAELEKQFGFDKPPAERFWLMLKNYSTFDFGESFYRSTSVVDLIREKLPVSISLGLWTVLLTYLISIPLGIRKAVRDGSKFDIWTSTVIVIGYSVPSFLFAILLIVLFAGGSYWQILPLRGLLSDNWDELTLGAKVLDYLWHLCLPITAMVIGAFATLTMLVKNSFLDEIHKLYVTTARAKGLTENRILYGHVFRNAILIVVAGFPGAFVSILFTQNLLIEMIFSLDGLGLLSFESIVNRDYPVVFGSLYIFTLIGLVLNLIGDLTYTLVDPRIDFESREA
jgi:microcin C transport system permease protein